MPSHSDGAMIQYHRKAIHVHSHIYRFNKHTFPIIGGINHQSWETFLKKNMKVNRNSLKTGNDLNLYFTNLLFLN